MKPLLLLVDLQRDYLDAPGMEPPAPALVRAAAALLEGCRERGVPVARVVTTVDRGDDRRMRHWRSADRWLCEAGTPGHAAPPELAPVGDEALVNKTGYRANLGPLLEDVAPDVLIVAGLHVHACVREAVLAAYERGGPEIWVADDAVASYDPLHAELARDWLGTRAARFAPAAELLAALDGGGLPAAAPPDVPQPALAAPLDARPILERLAELLEAAAGELADTMARDLGKPVTFGSLEVLRSAEMVRAVAQRAAAEPPPGHVRRRPHGVVAVVTPWNNPVYIPLGKIAPALAYGNAVLFKPAPAAHRIAVRLAELLAVAGLPAGALAVVPGGRAVAEAVMAAPHVAAVTLTGSSAAGYTAQAICARRRIPLQAELGGNNAALVWSDADLDHAAFEIAAGAFAQAGQRCTANRRVVVHRDCADELLRRLREEREQLEWGDPLAPGTVIGPLVSAAACERVAAVLGPAAVRRAPASVAGFDGAWLEPVVLECDDPTHELVQEETFGPLLVVQTAESWDHALELVNGVRQGLAAALFSRSGELAVRFADEAQAGIVKINRSTADAAVDVPFGGWKASGIGPPEHGEFDRDFYTRPQVVYS